MFCVFHVMLNLIYKCIFHQGCHVNHPNLSNVPIRFWYFLWESAWTSVLSLPHVRNCGTSALTEWKSLSSDPEWHSRDGFSVMRLVSAMSTINQWWLFKQETKLTVFSIAVCFPAKNICVCVFVSVCLWSCVNISFHVWSPAAQSAQVCVRVRAEPCRKLRLADAEWVRLVSAGCGCS